jgi:signal transduction histidine kinase
MLEVVQDALGVMKSDIGEHRIEVAVVHDSKLPVVMADPQQMKQVFFNIVKNAMQAMNDGGRLEIRLAADDRDLSIAFKDTGTGIGDDDFHRLFEPFHTGKATGHGLGLTIVQRIVQDHGGRLEVSTKQGEGTCFRIVLPVADRRARMITARDSKPSDNVEDV